MTHTWHIYASYACGCDVVPMCHLLFLSYPPFAYAYAYCVCRCVFPALRFPCTVCYRKGERGTKRTRPPPHKPPPKCLHTQSRCKHYPCACHASVVTGHRCASASGALPRQTLTASPLPAHGRSRHPILHGARRPRHPVLLAPSLGPPFAPFKSCPSRTQTRRARWCMRRRRGGMG